MLIGRFAPKGDRAHQETEREIEDEQAAMTQQIQDQQLREYEEGLRDMEEADRQRWEAYEAAKEAENKGASSSSLLPRVRVVMQGHDAGGQVLERGDMDLPLVVGGTLTLGIQLLQGSDGIWVGNYGTC